MFTVRQTLLSLSGQQKLSLIGTFNYSTL